MKFLEGIEETDDKLRELAELWRSRADDLEDRYGTDAAVLQAKTYRMCADQIESVADD